MAATELDLAVPTVDLDDLASDNADRRARAARGLLVGYGDYGLVYLAGHGIDRDEVDALYDRFNEVLERPTSEKATWGGADIWYQRGWTPPNTEKAVVAGGQPDFKECYFCSPTDADPEVASWYPEIYAPNVWPKDADAFRHGMLKIGGRIHDVGVLVLRGVAEALGLDGDTLAAMTNGAPNVTRILKYLSLNQDQVDAGTLWGEEHTDFNLLTLLPGGRLYDPTGRPGTPPGPGGLFLRTRPTERHPNGIKVQGVTPPGCIVSQVGQQLEILTGGRLQATPHVITAPSTPGWTRASLAHFLHVHANEVLFPLPPFRTPAAVQAYAPPVLAGTYDTKTLIDIGLAPAERLNRFGYRHYDRLADIRAREG
jgi:isopenicillin N synthase-like dioxygenase